VAVVAAVVAVAVAVAAAAVVVLVAVAVPAVAVVAAVVAVAVAVAAAAPVPPLSQATLRLCTGRRSVRKAGSSWSVEARRSGHAPGAYTRPLLGST